MAAPPPRGYWPPCGRSPRSRPRPRRRNVASAGLSASHLRQRTDATLLLGPSGARGGLEGDRRVSCYGRRPCDPHGRQRDERPGNDRRWDRGRDSRLVSSSRRRDPLPRGVDQGRRRGLARGRESPSAPAVARSPQGTIRATRFPTTDALRGDAARAPASPGRGERRAKDHQPPSEEDQEGDALSGRAAGV